MADLNSVELTIGHPHQFGKVKVNFIRQRLTRNLTVITVELMRNPVPENMCDWGLSVVLYLCFRVRAGKFKDLFAIMEVVFGW